jgi:menaquinone-dependent protoporphyrinogen IX oxidase
MSRKVLIAYETRYGATEGTSEKFAKALQGERLDVRVVNISFEMAIISC